MSLLPWYKKEYTLWHDWRIKLRGEYERIDNGSSAQLATEDGSRIIYGSSFVLSGVDDVEDRIDYQGIKRENTGSYTLSATVVQDSEFLTVAITYLDPSDEKWARSVIESAFRH